MLAEFKRKRARFDENATLPVFGFVLIDKPMLTASYKVSYLIAEQGKLHSIGEKLVKPAALKMANIMFGKATENKLSQIPLSNETISNRIDKMSDDIVAQIVSDLISSAEKFSLQLDKSTEVFNPSQLDVFLCYVKEDVIKEGFLFCLPLTTTTKAADDKKLVDNFFRHNDRSWLYSFCNLFGRSFCHVGIKFWFWCTNESRCTIHNCNTLSFAQVCIGNKNLSSKTGRIIKNCRGMCELCMS